MPDSSHYHLQSVVSGRRYRADEVEYLCPVASRKQQPGRALQGILEVVYDYDFLRTQFNRQYLEQSTKRGTQRYFPLLPLSNKSYLSSLLIGDTPLYSGGRLGRHLGLRNLFLKDDTRNPAGSYKDRASVLVVAKALEKGVRTVCTASTGYCPAALSADSITASVPS